MHGKQSCLICVLLGFFGWRLYGTRGDSSKEDEMQDCPRRDHYTNRCYDIEDEETTCLRFVFEDCPRRNPYCRPEVGFVEVPCTKEQCVDVGCCDGYIENNAGKCISEKYIASVKCQNGATKTQFGVCLCTEHYIGSRCHIPNCRGPCKNDGRCEVDDEGIPRCVCPSSFYSGEFCQSVSCIDKCRNGGECQQNGIWSRCACTYGYQGDLCQFPIREECQVVESNSHAACVPIWNECETDEHCRDEGSYTACCFTGCKGMCRTPELKECHHNDMVYHWGGTFSPNSCEECACQLNGNVTCTTMENKALQCPNGQNSIAVQEHCCQVCSGMENTDKEVPQFTNCPEQFIVVNVTEEGDTADLPPLYLAVVHLYATKLDISYSQETFKHSRKIQIKHNINIVTAFTQCDEYGRRAKCNFRVFVKDPFPPVVKACPSDLHGDTNLVINWDDPEFTDNVDVYDIEVKGDWIRGRSMPPGTYTISYNASDYDRNTAVCTFQAHVNKKSYEKKLVKEFENKLPIGTIIGVGAAVLVFMGVCTCLTIRLSKLRRQQEREEEELGDSSGSVNGPDAEHTPDWEDDLHSKLPKLPDYSPRSEPPTYDEIEQSMSKNSGKNIYEEINEVTTPRTGELAPQRNGAEEINEETTPTREQVSRENEVVDKDGATPSTRKATLQANGAEDLNDATACAMNPTSYGKGAADTREFTTPAVKFACGGQVEEVTPATKSASCRNIEEVNDLTTHAKTSASEENGAGEMNEVTTPVRKCTSATKAEEINEVTKDVQKYMQCGKGAENINEVTPVIRSMRNVDDVGEINEAYVNEVNE